MTTSTPPGGALLIARAAGRLSRQPGPGGSGALALFVALGVVNVSNFAFNLLMSRLLGVAVYGALGSLLGLATVVAVASGGAQAAVTQVVAAGGGAGSSRIVGIGRPLRWGLLAGAAAMVAVAAATPGITSFLHIRGTLPVVWLAVYLVPLVACLLPQGVLLGQLRFRAVALANVAGAGTRLLAGAALVEAGFGLSGAVAASTLGGALMLALLVWPLRHDVRRGPGTDQLRLRLRAAMLSLVAVAGYSLFLGVDSVLARHFLAPEASGYYVAALTAGRIALFLPGAVAVIAFPYFAAANRDGPDAARRHLRSALAVVGALGAVAAAVMVAVPGLVVTTLFGARYRPAAGDVGILAVAAAAVGLVNVLTYFYLSRRSRRSLTVWAGIAAAAAGIAVFHASPGTVATVMLAVSAAVLAALLVPTGAVPELTSRPDAGGAGSTPGRHPPRPGRG